MKPFSEVWAFTDTIPGSFNWLSGTHYYDCAIQCKNLMIEVGVDQGRSASILLAAAEQTGARVILIDSWESVLIDNKFKVQELVKKFNVETTIIHERSERAHQLLTEQEAAIADLVHIDANHYDDNPDKDCRLWLPHLKQGGFACFHDYQSTFPAVTEAVNKHASFGWKDLGVWESLAIRRKW